MKYCKICGSNNVTVTYEGPIRIGQSSKRTEKEYELFECKNCGTIWHKNDMYDAKEYYESTQYRLELEGAAGIEDYYINHDRECMDKFLYTGTSIFRNKIVADIGCGGGSWLDFLKGVAEITIAVEPSAAYRKYLIEKGHKAYAYVEQAVTDLGEMVDVITTFDVIEHVDDPQKFTNGIYSLLKNGGDAIIGTPTDLKHLRELLGTEFDGFVFSVQHPWVLGEKAIKLLCEKAGFREIEVKQFTRYGLGNVFAWLKDKAPKGHITYPCISETMEEAWKYASSEHGYGDYLVAYAKK